MVQTQRVGGAVLPGKRRVPIDRSSIRQVAGTLGQRVAIMQMHGEIVAGVGLVQHRRHEPGHVQPLAHRPVAVLRGHDGFYPFLHRGGPFRANRAGGEQALIFVLQFRRQGDAAHWEFSFFRPYDGGRRGCMKRR